MSYRKLILILFFILIAPGFSLKIEASQNAFLKAGVYTNPSKGYSIQFPLWWKVEEAEDGNRVKASRPPENSKDPFQEKIALSLVKSPIPLSTDAFFEENLKGLQKLNNYQEIKKGETTLNQHSAKWILYSFLPEASKDPVTTLQYFLVHQEQTYILTFVSTPLQFEQYKNKFQEIAQSLKIGSIQAL